MKTNICLIAPSLGMGGIERRLSILANYFQENYTQVHYIIVYNKEHFYQLNPGVICYEPKFKRLNTNKFLYNFKAYYFVRRTVKRIKPDVILSFGEHLNPYLLLTLLFLKYPHVISDSGSPVLKHNLIIKFLKKTLYPRASAYIAQTSKAAEIKKNIFGKGLRLKVIPNPARKVKLYSNILRKNKIAYIGRLHKEKGIQELIDIFSEIENKANWKLIIAGSGVHSGLLKTQVESLNLNNSVEFIGKVKDVDLLLAECKIFAFTSPAEGFPNSVLEALCAGVPVISYDCIAGPSEMIVNGENGFLVELGNKKEFAERLSFLMNNEKERARLGKNAQKIYEKFKLEIVGKKYLDFLLESAQNK